MTTIVERFLNKVNKHSGRFCKVKKTECWEWLATKDLAGYGSFSFSGKQIKASKASYIIFVGDFPANKHALHTCDWPSCVNPEHIFPGTHQDNMTDKKMKGRAKGQQKGSLHSLAQLVDEDIVKMFELNKQGHTAAQIAIQFNISEASVVLILQRKRWSHVNVGDAVYEPFSTRRFSDDDIIRIFYEYKEIKSMEKLAKKYETSTYVIHSILTRKNYKDVIIPSQFLCDIPKSYKLTESQILEIFDLFWDGYKLSEIADKYNVDKSTINLISKKKIWSDLLKDKVLPSEQSRLDKLRQRYGTSYKIPESVLEQAKEILLAGESIASAATILKIERHTLAENLKKLGFVIPKLDKTGEKNPFAKIKNESVPEIIELRKQGLTLKEIGKQFDVSYGTIHRIVNK
jgi:DNA invertase Pin-like site-specific DNA recombinase